MYEQFGARLLGKKVEFRLFLPDKTLDGAQYVRGGEPRIREVRLIGDFQHLLGETDWDRDGATIMERTAHLHGQLYQFTTP